MLLPCRRLAKLSAEGISSIDTHLVASQTKKRTFIKLLYGSDLVVLVLLKLLVVAVSTSKSLVSRSSSVTQ